MPVVPFGQTWDAPGIPRLRLPNIEAELHPLANEFGDLGVTPNLADEVIIKVYDLKCAHEDWLVPFRFAALCRIADSRKSEALGVKVVQERSLGRHTPSEITAAYGELRLPDPFAPHSPHITEERLVEALQTRIVEVEHPARRAVLLQAAKTVADFHGSEYFKAVLESSAGELGGATEKPTMDLDAACRALGIGKELEDDMVLMTYEVRVSAGVVKWASGAAHSSSPTFLCSSATRRPKPTRSRSRMRYGSLQMRDRARSCRNVSNPILRVSSAAIPGAAHRSQ